MKCSFCSRQIEKGTGKTLIHSTGKIFYYCSSKCEVNQQKLGRDPRNFKWAQVKTQ
ncbi:MAG TPA: 50S ribosomal protein L24e [Candidatus Aenigmarchaeota archaeon]|nr:50S ribosomal protein L24e [Candidatus Aenigmarchaeota archaeon]